MKEMSKFLSSLVVDPEEQRFNKAAIHLRALIFARLSDDHVIALALLHELRVMYDEAFGSDQVLRDPSRATQAEALEAHLSALELPTRLEALEPYEVQQLIDSWDSRTDTLPRPFGATLQSFISYAKTHQHATRSASPAHRYQMQ